MKKTTKRVNFNLSIDLYNFLKEYSSEKGITFTTAIDRFLSRSIEQYQLGQTVQVATTIKEEPIKEETKEISSFNGSDNEVSFAHLENETDYAILEMFNNIPRG